MLKTTSEENYIKTIYNLSRKGDDKISVTAIAESLGNNPASVIDMLKKLTEKGLIEYDKKQGARLSENGLSGALMIVRRHRLWEVFLHDKLGFSWDEVHDMAEQLEHVRNPDLADRLEKFLGFPKYDPHGDPIPQADGKVPTASTCTLIDTEINQNCMVTGIKDTSAVFLQYLEQLNITIGTKLTVKEKISYDNSMRIDINNEKGASVSKKFAENILIELAK